MVRRMASILLIYSFSQLELAKTFLKETVLRGEKVLFVGTKQARELFEKVFEANQPYVIHRWLGGILQQ